jgi:hypothetical protein
MDFRKLIKECVTQVLREELEDPLYVEYISERPGEDPFVLGGKKFQYVNAKYPNGKIDIGVYTFAGDIVYSYNAFRQMYNIQEAFDPTSVGPNPEASEGLSDGNPYAAWNARMRQMEDMELPIDDKTTVPPPHPDDQTSKSELPPSGEEKYLKQQPGGEMSAVNAATIANETMGRYAQEAGADGFGPKDFAIHQNDGFDELRKEIGVKKVNEFLAKFGLGPNYKPAAPKLHECPQCKMHNAQYKEEHPDTDMNEMVMECPDCGYSNS